MKTLLTSLRDCEALLTSVGESFWADKIKRILSGQEERLSDHRLLEIISWYGGMGSFNDLVISELNQHSFEACQEEALNRELGRLRAAIFDEVTQLCRGGR